MKKMRDVHVRWWVVCPGKMKKMRDVHVRWWVVCPGSGGKWTREIGRTLQKRDRKITDIESH